MEAIESPQRSRQKKTLIVVVVIVAIVAVDLSKSTIPPERGLQDHTVKPKHVMKSRSIAFCSHGLSRLFLCTCSH